SPHEQDRGTGKKVQAKVVVLARRVLDCRNGRWIHSFILRFTVWRAMARGGGWPNHHCPFRSVNTNRHCNQRTSITKPIAVGISNRRFVASHMSISPMFIAVCLFTMPML